MAGRPISGNYKNVEHIGFRKDMPDVFRSADFTILASRYEAFGQVAIESVACGTPVVLANNVRAAEVISDDVKFLFDRNSFESFENAIKQAITAFPHSKIEDPIQHMKITTDVAQHAADILLRVSTNRMSSRREPIALAREILETYLLRLLIRAFETRQCT